MSSDTETKGPVYEYVEALDAALKPLFSAMRQLMRELAPEAREAIKWSSLCYEQRGNFCSIMPADGYLRLQFFRGTDLHDPNGLLEGTGKGGRHIKIWSVDQTPWEAIKALVRDAVRVNASR